MMKLIDQFEHYCSTWGQYHKLDLTRSGHHYAPYEAKETNLAWSMWEAGHRNALEHRWGAPVALMSDPGKEGQVVLMSQVDAHWQAHWTPLYRHDINMFKSVGPPDLPPQENDNGTV